MMFDPNNRIIQLCTQGMQKEAELEPAKAQLLFIQAWQEAVNDLEKFVAAHYVARHQESTEDKLKWDELALSLAIKFDDVEMKANLPSLHLNIGKCYEDFGNIERAREHYVRAKLYIEYLPVNGYGQMMKAGIKAGLSRVSE